MKQLVAQAMEQGALGLSTSLQYVPDRFASTDEIVELAKVAARYGGVYFTHQRSESVRIFESLDEVFAIAERASIPAEIWHLKTAYKASFGKMPEVLQRHRSGAGARPRRHRQSVSLHPRVERPRLVPAAVGRAKAGSRRPLARLKDPATRERIKTRHGRCERHDVGEPVVRRERRRRRDGVDRPRTRRCASTKG